MLIAYSPAFGKHSATAMTVPLNDHRAELRYRCASPRTSPDGGCLPDVAAPEERAPFLISRLADDLEPWVRKLNTRKLPAAGHWLLLKHAEEVNKLLLACLGMRTY